MSPFTKILSTSTALVFMLSVSLLSAEASATNNGAGPGAFFNRNKPIAREFQRALISAPKRPIVAGYAIDIDEKSYRVEIAAQDIQQLTDNNLDDDVTPLPEPVDWKDFELYSMITSPQIITGGPGYVSIVGTLQYDGSGSFSGTLTADCYVNDVLVGDWTYTYTNLEPGIATNVQCDDDWQNITTGEYELKMVIDPENVYSESDEENNSHTITVQTTDYVEPTFITVTSPNGGETFVQGQENIITWDGGRTTAMIGLVQAEATNDNWRVDPPENNTNPYYSLGWIAQVPATEGQVAWDATETCDAQLGACRPLMAGTYKIIVVSEDEIGNMSLSNSQGIAPNLDISDAPFKISEDVSDQDSDEIDDLIIVCHYNRGIKQYVRLRVNESSYKRGHSGHDNDFILSNTDRRCVDVAVAEGIIDDPSDDQDPVPLPEPIDDDGPVADSGSNDDTIVELQQRIKKLRLRVSELEQEVVKREKDRVRIHNQNLSASIGKRLLLDAEGDGGVYYNLPEQGFRVFIHKNNVFDSLRVLADGIDEQDFLRFRIYLAGYDGLADSDDDGLPDQFEDTYGTDPNNPDTDGDGYNDHDELAASYDPTEPNNVPLPIDDDFACKQRGRMFMLVSGEHARGQAVYINENCEAVYMPNPEIGYKIMGEQSLGTFRRNLNELSIKGFEEISSDVILGN